MAPLRIHLLITLLAVSVGAGACGGGPSTPQTPTTPAPNPTPTPPASGTVLGSTVDAFTDRPLPGVTVRIAGYPETTTDTAGEFRLEISEPEQLRAVTIASSATVERQTRIRVPGRRATITLMPSSFDLTAFNEMCRSGGALHRWTSAPRVVIQQRVLQFTTVNDQEYVALASVMPDRDASDLLADLTWALPQLTGGTFASFADAQFETAAEGERVRVTNRPGAVIVARYEGLTAATTFWGYTRWSWNGAGEMLTGIVMLDNGFENSGSRYRRSLRSHELGHAMSYTHVTARTSVMNANAQTEPNTFDRDGGRFAFLRPPLNRSPDIDPDPYSANLEALAQQVFWRGMH